MTDDEQLYEELAAIKADDVDGIDALFERMSDLAKLKHRARPDYERLFATWRAKRVPRLPHLDRAVDQLTREITRKRRTGAPKPGKDGFIRDQNGAIMGNPDNIRTAISKLGVTLSYDDFRGWPKIDGLQGFGPSLADAALDRLWLAMDEQFGFRPSQRLFRTVASDLSVQNKYHPVRDYLDGLVWDGKMRIDNWLSKYCKAESTPYSRAVGSLILVAAVRRVRQPGVKFDEMLVLESSEQGYSKSSMIEAVAVHEDWYSDSVPLNADDKVMIERSSGKWILEVGELQGMRKGEVEKIRAQLSRRTDRARLAYERLPVEIPRQSVMFATTNGDRDAPYLADINGNRRIWPIEVGRCDVAAMVRDRDQLWAEAAAREATGASIRLAEELWAAARVEQDARAIGNAFEDKLSGYLVGREGIIRADDAWTLVGIPVERRDSQAGKFGKAMKSLGWTRTKKRTGGGNQPWVYVKGERGIHGAWVHVERDVFGRDFVVKMGAEPATED